MGYDNEDLFLLLEITVFITVNFQKLYDQVLVGIITGVNLAKVRWFGPHPGPTAYVITVKTLR